MRYLSVCSGIEAATVAWKPLGWKAAAFSEIENAPRAVLAHHYPTVPLHGDFTTIGADDYGAVDLLVGGTPCQSFSIAGLRKGLDDDRGNLALEYLRLADRKRPRWLVWENVPGVLSSNEGRDFGSFLGALGELGYGFAYRVLDAQFFGVAQRRRRVFVVGYAGDWRPSAAVLFERYGLQGHPAPRREAGQGVAGNASVGTATRCWPSDVAPTLNAAFGSKMGLEDQHALGGAGHFVAHPIAFSAKDHGADASDIAPTLRSGGHDKSHANGGVMPAVEFNPDVYATLGASEGGTLTQVPPIMQGSAVRRLTPVECERLQGFPDDYTLVPYRNGMMKDGPRYKMLGNSMAVPVMRWIGERIVEVEAVLAQRDAA